MPIGQQLLHIVHGCVKANRQSQKEFYKFYYGFAKSICMRYCDYPDEVVEIVNDSFLKIFKTIASFNPRYENYEASLIGWMKSIIIHTAIDYFRKSRKNYVIDEIEEMHFEIYDSCETSIDRMSYKEIFELVQKLSPVYRTVFNLYVIDGFKHEEIANQLNISVGTSKSNLAKARVNIQKMLKALNPKLYEQRRAI
ncbi:MAG: sigma-70 family RNA polymerase sigma factor [Ferruginibacter sp.]